MKQLMTIALAAALFAGVSTTAIAQSKVQKRYDYTMRNLHLDKKTEALFAPVLKAYLAERKTAGDIYDDVKDKYKAAEKAGTLTDNQANQLLEAKLKSEEQELVVRRKYTAEFKKVLKPKKVYYALDFANDSMNKIEGKGE